MKGRLIKMKKSTKVIGGIVTIAAIAGVVLMTTSFHTPPKKVAKQEETLAEEQEKKDVKVEINKDITPVKEYTEIIDEETGETQIAEVQENVPPEPKPQPPKEAPKASGDYKNPSSPPTYTKEQTVSEKKPEEKPVEAKKQGQAYVEGFGYVDVGAPTKTTIGVSDGDINKQVGIMD